MNNIITLIYDPSSELGQGVHLAATKYRTQYGLLYEEMTDADWCLLQIKQSIALDKLGITVYAPNLSKPTSSRDLPRYSRKEMMMAKGAPPSDTPYTWKPKQGDSCPRHIMRNRRGLL